MNLGSLIKMLVDDGASFEVAGEAIALAYGAGAASVGPVRSAGAERTARWRERHKASQSVTDRLAVTGETQKESSPLNPLKEKLPPSEAKASSAPKGASRGCRLPDDFPFTESRLAYAMGKGLSEQRARVEFEKFCAHFRSASGANATKINWDQAWQKWVLNAVDRFGTQGRRDERTQANSLVAAGQQRIADIRALRAEHQSGSGGDGLRSGNPDVRLLPARGRG